MEKIIKGNIVNVETGEILKDFAIHIKDGMIVGLAPLPEEEKPHFTQYIIPGLIDSHMHLNFSGSEKILDDFFSSDHEELYELGARTARQALESGITTIRDCASISQVVFKLRDHINEGILPGARIFSSGEAITSRKGHIHFLGLEADSSQEMIDAADKILDQGADFIKLIVSGGNSTPGSRDNLDQYEYEEIKALTDHVHSRGKKIMAHIHTKVGMEKAIKAGIDYIEHGSWRIDDDIEIDYELIDEMKEKGLVYCTAIPMPYFEKDEKLHKNRRLTTVANMKYKDNVFLGTDAGTTNNRVTGLLDQAIYLQRETDFSNLDILRMMTLNPGRHLLDGRLGQIKEGMIADLLFLRDNPLLDLRNLKKINAVYKEGVKFV